MKIPGYNYGWVDGVIDLRYDLVVIDDLLGYWGFTKNGLGDFV